MKIIKYKTCLPKPSAKSRMWHNDNILSGLKLVLHLVIVRFLIFLNLKIIFIYQLFIYCIYLFKYWVLSRKTNLQKISWEWGLHYFMLLSVFFVSQKVVSKGFLKMYFSEYLGSGFLNVVCIYLFLQHSECDIMSIFCWFEYKVLLTPIVVAQSWLKKTICSPT